MKDNKLEKLLTYYCKMTTKPYIQGLNFVAIPFLLFLKFDNVQISDIYNYLLLFIERYLPTIFNDEKFYTLEASLTLFNTLTKYHDPEL